MLCNTLKRRAAYAATNKLRVLADDLKLCTVGPRGGDTREVFKRRVHVTLEFLQDMGARVSPTKCLTFANHREARADRFTDPIIVIPDNSYWVAMGCYHPKRDLTIKQNSLGCWINQAEREMAWEDQTFFTDLQRQQRAPRLTTALPTHRDVRRQAGRAVSHAPNRRGYRR